MRLNSRNLELAMANACINVRELAEKANVSSNTLFKIRSGEKEARPQTIGKLARALNIPAAELIEQEG